jgi:hypothetical protein
MQAGQHMGWGHLRTGPNHDKGMSCHGWAKRTAFVPVARSTSRYLEPDQREPTRCKSDSVLKHLAREDFKIGASVM